MKKILLVSCILVLAACSTQPADDSPIVIGGISALSGDEKLFGTTMQQVIQLRIDQINERGGIDGRLLEIIWADGMCTAEGGTEAIQELTKTRKMNIVLGGVCSDSTLAILENTDKKEIFLLSPSATSPKLTNASDFFFRTYPSDTVQGKTLGTWAEHMPYEKIAELIQPTEWTKGISHEFRKSYPGNVDKVELGFEEQDFSQTISELRNKGVDALFFNFETSPRRKDFLQSLIDEGWCPPILGNEFLVVDAINKEAKELSEYRECSKDSEIIGASFEINRQGERFKNFADEYEEFYGTSLRYESYSAAAVDLVDVLFDALFYMDDINDHSQMRESLLLMQHVGLSGTISFDKNGDVKGEYSLLRYRDGKYEIIAK